MPSKQSAPPSGSDTSEPAELSGSRERWPYVVAGIVMLMTLIPYLIGWSWSDGRRFMWLGYNLDDSCVYLSWMRQAAEGSLRAYNLFTTDPQSGMAMNPLFLALGFFARLTQLPLLAVYHGSRLIFGYLLLILVWGFLRLTVPDRPSRCYGFLFVCFSSGLGWLPFWWDAFPLETPIDKWQPEAITFLSIYMSPLFAFSMALQVGILLLLLLGERTGRMRYALYAGIGGFVLGLTHSYDIISLTAVWLGFLIITTLESLLGSSRQTASDPASIRTLIAGSWLRGLTAGALTIPSVLYMYLQYKNEAVFRARAEVPTLSPSPTWLMAGYGLTLVLALIGCYVILKARSEHGAAGGVTPEQPYRWRLDPASINLLILWALLNCAVSYLPKAAFQRKLLQGAHFPIAILAGIGFAYLLALVWRAKENPNAPAKSLFAQPLFLGSLAALLLGITNIRFLIRELVNFSINLSQTRQQRPYLQPGEIEALHWIATNTPREAAVQPLPWVAQNGETIGTSDVSVACFTPGLIHRKVYCGHWGETPDYGGKLRELRTLTLPTTPDEVRKEMLKKMAVRYLLFSQKAQNDAAADNLAPMFRERVPLPSYLKRVYSNPEADVYEVVLE